MKEYKKLEEMGFNKLMIKKVYDYFKPKSLEDAIQLLIKNNNNIYQHKFFPDNVNKCFDCEKEAKYHIDYKKYINDDYIGDTIGEAKIGDNVEIDEETKNQLISKGEKATCKIFVKYQNGK